jgi:hypothetical protein
MKRHRFFCRFFLGRGLNHHGLSRPLGSVCQRMALLVFGFRRSDPDTPPLFHTSTNPSRRKGITRSHLGRASQGSGLLPVA